MHLRIGFSPCPNDTFIFYALLHGKIDTCGITFHPVLADVESLNRKAIATELDITKISFAAYPFIQAQYILLTSGSALGNQCGPLLISRKIIRAEDMALHSVSIPGKYTTANFLFETFFPEHGRKTEMVFHEIEDAVLLDKTDTGVIIHENRFTYEKKGLRKIMDLGEQWEQSTGHPIPLGGIAIRRTLNKEVAILVNTLIGQSVQYAFAHPEEAIGYVQHHAQEMDHSIMWQHIKLYVNDFTISLGEKGKAAIEKFLDYATEQQLMKEINRPLFVQ